MSGFSYFSSRWHIFMTIFHVANQKSPSFRETTFTWMLENDPRFDFDSLCAGFPKKRVSTTTRTSQSPSSSKTHNSISRFFINISCRNNIDDKKGEEHTEYKKWKSPQHKTRKSIIISCSCSRAYRPQGSTHKTAHLLGRRQQDSLVRCAMRFPSFV